MTIKNSNFVKILNLQNMHSCLKIIDLGYFLNFVTFLCYSKNSELSFDKIQSLFSFYKKQT